MIKFLLMFSSLDFLLFTTETLINTQEYLINDQENILKMGLREDEYLQGFLGFPWPPVICTALSVMYWTIVNKFQFTLGQQQCPCIINHWQWIFSIFWRHLTITASPVSCSNQSETLIIENIFQLCHPASLDKINLFSWRSEHWWTPTQSVFTPWQHYTGFLLTCSTWSTTLSQLRVIPGKDLHHTTLTLTILSSQIVQYR